MPAQSLATQSHQAHCKATLLAITKAQRPSCNRAAPSYHCLHWVEACSRQIQCQKQQRWHAHLYSSNVNLKQHDNIRQLLRRAVSGGAISDHVGRQLLDRASAGGIFAPFGKIAGAFGLLGSRLQIASRWQGDILIISRCLAQKQGALLPSPCLHLGKHHSNTPCHCHCHHSLQLAPDVVGASIERVFHFLV